MSTLLIISPAPVLETPSGEVVLDSAFTEGMKLHCQLWPGRVYCLMRRGAQDVPNGMRFSPRQLDFSLIVLDQGAPLPEALLDEARVVYCAADDMAYLDLPARLKGRTGKLVYTIERPLSERLRLAAREPSRSALSRLRGVQWALSHEPALRRALRRADGLHCNGPLAGDAYGQLNPSTLVYMDNRIRLPVLAREADQDARAERLRAGAPLTLATVAPLTAEYGAADLIDIAKRVQGLGVDFRLQIFGAGPFSADMEAAIAAHGLQDRVHLDAPPGFDTRMAPYLRATADVFLAPWRVTEPVSGLIEAMGCGLPVLGYADPFWRRVQALSQGGWTVRPVPAAMARRIAALDKDRQAIIDASARALDYARANTFETVFARRMSHLRQVAGID